MDRTGSVYEEDSRRRLPRRPAVAGLLATTKTFEPAIALAEPASNTGATRPGAWEREILNLVLLALCPGIHLHNSNLLVSRRFVGRMAPGSGAGAGSRPYGPDDISSENYTQYF